MFNTVFSKVFIITLDFNTVSNIVFILSDTWRGLNNVKILISVQHTLVFNTVFIMEKWLVHLNLDLITQLLLSTSQSDEVVGLIIL